MASPARTECTKKQKDFITYLIEHQLSTPKTAKALGVSIKTAEDWWTHDYFRKEYDMQLKRFVDSVVPAAFQTLYRNLNCGHFSSEIGAANTILKAAGYLSEKREVTVNTEAPLDITVNYVEPK